MGYEQFSFMNGTLVNLIEQSNCIFHFYSKDQKGKYIDCNDTQAINVGLKVDDLIGLDDFDICSSKYASQFRSNDLKVMHRVSRYS